MILIKLIKILFNNIYLFLFFVLFFFFNERICFDNNLKQGHFGFDEEHCEPIIIQTQGIFLVEPQQHFCFFSFI